MSQESERRSKVLEKNRLILKDEACPGLINKPEIVHTAYGLADEYPYYAGGNETGHDHHPAGEPTEPNVTTNSDRNTLKWRWAVSSATAIPTMSNPNCSQVDNRPNPVATDTVGLFEGAHYYQCGGFRP